jgi:hypothetical protein
LRTDDHYKRSDGTLLVPEEVLGKLKDATSPDILTLSDIETRLKGNPAKNKTGPLSENEFALHSGDILDASASKDYLTNGTIGLYIGGIVVISGLVATLAGGLLGDYLRNRGVKGAYFLISGWGMVIAFPFFLAMMYVPFPYAWGCLFVSVFFLFFNTGPANTILANVVRSPIRATAFAINIFIIHALGDAISPLIIGFVADLTNLHTAFVAVSALIPISGSLWVWGANHLDEDTAAAEAGVTGPRTPAR